MNISAMGGNSNYYGYGLNIADPQKQEDKNKHINKITGKEECQTCKNRKYKDGSDDPGVSFKTAGKINPNRAAATVKGHEQEHVVRERAKAGRENKQIVSQSVRLKSDICPECGKSYVSGGETVTVTKSKPENRFSVGMPSEVAEAGSFLNKTA